MSEATGKYYHGARSRHHTLYLVDLFPNQTKAYVFWNLYPCPHPGPAPRGREPFCGEFKYLLLYRIWMVMKLLLFLLPMRSLPLWGRVRGCLQFKPAPSRASLCGRPPNYPLPRGGGSGWGQQTTARQVWNFVGLPCELWFGRKSSGFLRRGRAGRPL